MKARFPLLLLLGIVFLASVSVSFGIAYWERENPSHNKCMQSCNSEKDAYRNQACHARCNLLREEKQEEVVEEEEEAHSRHEERGHQQGEKEEEHEWHHKEERRQRGKGGEQEEEEKYQPREKKEQHQEREQDEDSESRRQNNNPLHFSPNKFRTLYKNQYGHIRILERFDQRSRQLQNLRDYSVLEYKSKPNTLLLPHHADADFLLVVLSGRAVLTLVNPDDRVSYNLESGDALRIRAGTTLYTLNPDNKENLRLIKLVMPVNKPSKLENFFLSSTQDQQSYLQGFSKNILEASFDTEYEEINRILFGEEKQSQEEEEGVIVEVSKEQIQELSRRAKSSSRKTISSEDEPFNLRSRKPIYSNKFGKFFEVTQEKNPQLQDLDILLSSVDMDEGALFLPHFNSKAIVILVVNEGEAKIELVGLKEQQQKQQEEETREVRRYRAELCEDHIFVIPAGYPVSVNATSNLNFLAFGINAENNQRNFLAGEKDNVISNIQRQVKELAFPGSAEEVEKLIKKQRDSYFVDAQPDQPKEQGRKGRKGPLSSILSAFY